MTVSGLSGLTYIGPYDVSPDGRFLFNCVAGKPASPTVVVNWQAELEARK